MFYEIFILIAILVLGFLFIIYRNKPATIDYNGKHVVITGGSQGIGYDLTINAFKQGAHVSVIARDEFKLEAVRSKLEHIQSKGSKHISQKIQIESLDVARSFEETKKTFERLVSNAGPVDILINNAGISMSAEFADTPIKCFEDMMRVNYLGSVYCTKSVIESMKDKRFGRVAFISSQAGQMSIFGYSGYSASKFALRGLAEALQMEVRPYNVYVTVAFPPDTDTPGFREENLTKAEETKLISESSAVCSSKKVAKKILKCIKNGTFNCYFGVNGYLLTCLSSATGPAQSFFQAIAQIVLLPFTRFVAVVLHFHFQSIVNKCYRRKTATKRI